MEKTFSINEGQSSSLVVMCDGRGGRFLYPAEDPHRRRVAPIFLQIIHHQIDIGDQKHLYQTGDHRTVKHIDDHPAVKAPAEIIFQFYILPPRPW